MADSGRYFGQAKALRDGSHAVRLPRQLVKAGNGTDVLQAVQTYGEVCEGAANRSFCPLVAKVAVDFEQRGQAHQGVTVSFKDGDGIHRAGLCDGYGLIDIF
jgi:hypothetical protein